MEPNWNGRKYPTPSGKILAGESFSGFPRIPLAPPVETYRLWMAAAATIKGGSGMGPGSVKANNSGSAVADAVDACAESSETAAAGGESVRTSSWIDDSFSGLSQFTGSGVAPLAYAFPWLAVWRADFAFVVAFGGVGGGGVRSFACAT